jgi:hypothetical protein
MNQVSTTAAQAATALREAAETTAHTLTGLVGDAHERLEHLHLPAVQVPSLHLPAIRRRPSALRVAAPWLVAGFVIAAVVAVRSARRRRGTSLHLAAGDTEARAHAA